MNDGRFALMGMESIARKHCVDWGFKGKFPSEFRPILCIMPGAVFLLFTALHGTSGYDRSGKCFRLDPNTGTTPDRLVFRSADCRNRTEIAIRERTGLCRS